MLEAVNQGCARGDRRLLKALNFSIKPGELIELRGANGSGNTSLLRILCGLATPAEGEVRWQATHIPSLGEEYSRVASYLAPQNGPKDELSAISNLPISARLAGKTIT